VFFQFAIRPSGVDGAAEAMHGCALWDVAVVSVDSVALSTYGEPHKRVRFAHLFSSWGQQDTPVSVGVEVVWGRWWRR
jgi:hypothetical protein